MEHTQEGKDIMEQTVISLKKQYMTDDAWLEFRRCVNDESGVEKHFVEDHFVEPELHNVHRSTQIETEGPVPLKEVFDPRHSQVCLKGEAGYGKSALCTKICLDWANGNANSVIPADKLLIMYRLKLLGESTSLRDELIKFVHSHSDLPEKDIKKVEDALGKKQTNIVLLLDGYDELGDVHKKQVKSMLTKSEKQQDLFRSAFTIVTTRNLNDEEFFTKFGNIFQISGLSKENRDIFVNKYFFGTDYHYQAEALKCQVDDLAINKPDAISPFLLNLFCFLQSELGLDHLDLDLERSLPSVVYLLAVRCNANGEYNYTREQLLEKLNKLAELLIRSKITETNVFLEKQLQEDLGNDFNFIIRCGYFKQLKWSKEKAYMLAHSLFQDYIPIQIRANEEPSVFRRARTCSGHLGIDFSGSVVQLDSRALGQTNYVTLHNIQSFVCYDVHEWDECDC